MNRFKIMAVLALALVFACTDNHECDCANEIYGKWEVTEFMSIESVLYEKNEAYNPTIEFKSDGSLAIKLDINACFGSIEVLADGEINISTGGCTEACCDSNFSNKFIEMLPQVKSYVIESGGLKLHVPEWGWLQLEPASE